MTSPTILLAAFNYKEIIKVSHILTFGPSGPFGPGTPISPGKP